MINYLILFKKFENYDDIPKIGFLFSRIVVMNPLTIILVTIEGLFLYLTTTQYQL